MNGGEARMGPSAASASSIVRARGAEKLRREHGTCTCACGAGPRGAALQRSPGIPFRGFFFCFFFFCFPGSGTLPRKLNTSGQKKKTAPADIFSRRLLFPSVMVDYPRPRDNLAGGSILDRDVSYPSLSVRRSILDRLGVNQWGRVREEETRMRRTERRKWDANLKIWDDATTVRNVRGQLPCPRRLELTRATQKFRGAHCGLRLADVMDAPVVIVSGRKNRNSDHLRPRIVRRELKKARHYSMQSRILGEPGTRTIPLVS